MAVRRLALRRCLREAAASHVVFLLRKQPPATVSKLLEKLGPQELGQLGLADLPFLLDHVAANAIPWTRLNLALIWSDPVWRTVPRHAQRELMKRGAPGPIASLARFAVDDSWTERLSGRFEFNHLRPEDVVLAACYYGGDGGASGALRGVRSRSDWGWERIAARLGSAAQGALGDFMIVGLQPRIAEIAYASIYDRVHGGAIALHDQNLETVRGLPQDGWDPERVRMRLPRTDWIDSASEVMFDVKCNLFFPHYRPARGLTGFLLGRNKPKRDDAKGSSVFAGFVMFGASDSDCSWAYVGEHEARPSRTDTKGERVSPFHFAMPPVLRAPPATAPSDEDLRVLNEGPEVPRVAWLLSLGRRIGLGLAESRRIRLPAKLLAAEWIEGVLDRLADGATLETEVWRATTDWLLKARSRGEAFGGVEESLSWCSELLDSEWFPVKLPRIGGRPLLGHWIEEVLRRVNRVWEQICCPRCSGSDFSLELQSMDAVGTVKGRFKCRSAPCQAPARTITVLAHCRCGAYPLILGQNPVCANPTCGWLVCQCGRCSPGCER